MKNGLDHRFRPAHRRRRSRLRRILAPLPLSVVVVLSGLGLALGIVPASAAGTVTLAESAPTTVLYGSPATVTLTATNPSTTPVYNVSFRDVLPLGVSYVPGSTTTAGQGSSDPEVLVNQPGPGQTTLVWRNHGDLQAASSLSLAYKVQAATDTGSTAGANPVLPGSSYGDATSVYVSSDPRYVPSFDATGVPSGNFTDEASASGTTTVTSLAVSLAPGGTAGQQLRGVHDHQSVATLTVTATPLYATDDVTVTDYLPAGLEFLGCGGSDNTTDAVGTNPGSTDEYPGSGSLAVTAPLDPSVCPAPVSVETVENPVRSDGTQLTGVFTAVTWSVGTLGGSSANVATIKYVTGIPLRENTTIWATGTAPGSTCQAGTCAQAANLDNNSGPETYDGQSLVSFLAAAGTYAGPTSSGDAAVDAFGSAAVTAVDFLVAKSLTPVNFVANQLVTVSLNYQVGEYRYVTSTTLGDTLPTGLCPLSATTNYADDAAAAECAPQAGTDPSLPYASVSENADGSFPITWDPGTLAPNVNSTVTFTALDRPRYVAAGSTTTPVLAGDGLVDHASLTGTTHATCYSGSVGAATADPTCSGGGTAIYAGETTEATPTRTSSAAQNAPQPVLTKRVSAAVAPPGPIDCATATYLDASSPGYPPSYQQGDHVCFQIEMDFPLGVATGNPVVSDFLPPNTTYVSSSPTAANTVTIGTGDPVVAGSSPDRLTWTLGDPEAGAPGLFVGSGQIFEVDIEVTLDAPPAAGNAYSTVANLAKATAVNSGGQAISLRADATYDLSRPLLTLAKSVVEVNGQPPVGSPPVVHAGDVVTYAIVVSNSGLKPADNVEIWDNLPSQISGTAPLDCATVTSAVSVGGACATGTRIEWPASLGISVPAATLSAGTPTPSTTTLTYHLTIPDIPAAGETLVNQAGVVSYQGPDTNVGGSPPTFYPPSNIDPTAPDDPTTTTRADDTATVTLPSAVVTKVRTTSVNEAGNNTPSQATIGETITYTVTATVPAGSTVYAATLTDPLGSRQTLVPGSVSATLNGADLPVGFTQSAANNTPTVTFPASFGPFGTDQVLSLTLSAVVADGAANVRGSSVTNRAGLSFNDSAGQAVTVNSPTVSTTVVEPSVSLTKADAPGGPYASGATVNYTLTATNSSATNVSTAHDLVVTDNVPAGVVPVVGSVSNGGIVSGSPGAYVITWTLPGAFSLAPGASQVLAYSATLPTNPVGQTAYVNRATATVTSLDLGGYPGARTSASTPGVGPYGGYVATASDTVAISGVGVAKSASPTSVATGVATTYTATVTIPADLEFPQLTAIDTLPDGMVFSSYGTGSCVVAGGGSCGSDVEIAPVGTPATAGNGTTALAWSLGNVLPYPGVRTVTLTYSAYASPTFAGTGGPVGPGTVLTNSVGAYWQDVAGPPPGTIPSPSSFPHGSPTADAPVTVTQPQLTLTKSVSRTTAAPGDAVTYRISVSNAGSPAHASCAYGATVVDPLPLGLTGATGLEASQGTASYDATTRTITWDPSTADPACPLGTAGGVAPGTVATLTYTSSIDPASAHRATGETNVATIASYYGVPAATATGDPDRYPAEGPLQASATVTPIFPAPVAAKSAPNGDSALIGTPFTWSFTLTNPAPAAPAFALSATDVLPAAWTYDTGSTRITTAGGTPVAGVPADPTVVTTGSGASAVETLTWSGTQLGDLTDPAASIVVTYTATPGPLTATGSGHPSLNAVSARAEDGSGAGGNADGPYVSNTASADAYLDDADLSITKTHVGSGPFTVGSTITYSLGVSNLGPSAARAPVVTDDLPSGLTYVSGSATGSLWSCGSAGTRVTCTYGSSLAAGTTAPPVTLSATVGADAYPSVVNRASVSSPTHDPDPTNNSAEDTATINPLVDLSVTKTVVGKTTVAAGNRVVFSLGVTNNGPTADPGPVTLSDPLPTGLTFVSATGAGWNCTDADNTVSCVWTGAYGAGHNSSVTVTALATTGAVGSVTNTASVTGEASDTDETNNTSSATVTVTPGARLVITKTLVGGTLTVGEKATYNLTVTNDGPSEADAVVVTDELPAGLAYVSASTPAGSCQATGQSVTCSLHGPLAVGAVADITLVALVGPTPLPIANSATVTSSTPLVDGSTTTAETPPVVAGLPFNGGGGGTTPGQLAWTGADPAGLLAGGLALVAVGLGLLHRRRRRA